MNKITENNGKKSDLKFKLIFASTATITTILLTKFILSKFCGVSFCGGMITILTIPVSLLLLVIYIFNCLYSYENNINNSDKEYIILTFLILSLIVGLIFSFF